jgi:DNA-binding Lrp family transcriptional regulator
VDSKDFRLLVALFDDPRQGFRAIGDRVGLSAPAVRDRIRRLQDRGVLGGFVLTPDASLLGRADRVVLFQGEWSREDALRVLRLPRVAWVAWKVDGGLTVQLWPRPGEDAVPALARSLGASPFFQTTSPARELRPVTVLDWRIVEALLDDPILPLKELVRRTGLSPKTVRRRLTGMVRDRVFGIVPQLGSLGNSGDLVFTVTVLGPIGFGEVRRIMGDAALLRRVPKPPAQYALCRAESLAEVTTRSTLLRRHPEVESAFVSLNREQLVNRPLIRTLVRERIRKLETGARRTPRR